MEALTRGGMTVLAAKRTIELLLECREATVDMRAVEHLETLMAELADCGITVELAPSEPASEPHRV
jgi:hypothetical protein